MDSRWWAAKIMEMCLSLCVPPKKMCSSFLYYVEMFDGGPTILMDVTFFSESEDFF